MADINQLVNRAEEFMTKAPYLPLGLAKEMIAALKEQEPVKPIRLENWWECPSCNGNIVANMKYCPNCGKAVKWDETD